MSTKFKSGVVALSLMAAFGISTAQTVSEPIEAELNDTTQVSTDIETPTNTDLPEDTEVATDIEAPADPEVAQGGKGATVYKPGEPVPADANVKITGNGHGASVVLPEAARFGQERAAAARAERAERVNKTERVERVERVARVEKIERPERVERPQRVERPEQAERPRR